MDFVQHVDRGYGPHWRGIIFRQTFPQLGDIIARSKIWIPKIFPEAKYNESKHEWVFPKGETLLLRFIRRPEDYGNYHGQEFPFVGWEELTNWSTNVCYELMKTCCRSSYPGMPRKYRSNCNPWGVGHDWVKSLFVDPAPVGTPIPTGTGEFRVRIHGDIVENAPLMEADPNYLPLLGGIRDENIRKAWRHGDWNIIAGGFFSDVWNEQFHVVPYFDPPKTWEVRRSFDWGSAKPSSLGFWAISDGREVEALGGRSFPRGSLIRFREWYTVAKDQHGFVIPNEGLRLTNHQLGLGVAERSLDREGRWSGCVADPSIFTRLGKDSIYEDLRKAAKEGGHKLSFGKAKTERVAGWQRLRQFLEFSAVERPESPGLWVCENCFDWLRTVPLMVRDSKNMDDLDTETEDHAADETRYACMSYSTKVVVQSRGW